MKYRNALYKEGMKTERSRMNIGNRNKKEDEQIKQSLEGSKCHRILERHVAREEQKKRCE